MSVAVLLLVSMAVGAGIVGTDKILSLIGGKKPGTTEVTGDDGGNIQFVTSRPAKLSAIFVKTDKLGLSSSSDIKTNSDIIAKAAENIKNKGFDSVFIAVSEESGFACSDGKIDALSVLSEKAKEQGLYVCLVYGGTEFGKDELSSLGSNFDCVAFSGDMTAEQRKNAVGTLHAENKSQRGALCQRLKCGGLRGRARFKICGFPYKLPGGQVLGGRKICLFARTGERLRARERAELRGGCARESLCVRRYGRGYDDNRTARCLRFARLLRWNGHV